MIFDNVIFAKVRKSPINYYVSNGFVFFNTQAILSKFNTGF